MAVLFDTLAASDALEAAGMDRQLARACAAQLQAAVSTGEAVTRPELEAVLAAQKAELLERLAETVTRPELEAVLAAQKAELLERLAETERRLAALLWRLFGGIVALAGLVVAALKLLP